MACGAFSPTPAAAQPAPVETAERVLPLEVTVNGMPGGIWPIVSRGGLLYAPVEAFGGWRIVVAPETPVLDYRGLRYHPLTAIRGLEGRIEKDGSVLALTVAAGSFVGTKLSRELAPVARRSESVPTLFLNYDLNYAQAFGSSSTRDLGLLGEAGWSSRWGLLTQTFVGRELASARARSFGRLETTFRHDFPDSGYTLVVGDSTVRTGLLGRAAYFGGIQFGTNFDLSPTVNRQPVPLIAGETSAPTVVQLYVNDVLRQTSSVPAGPFALDNLPTLSGNGNVTLRMRDILGRETLITQPFFVSADLLAAGLDDWSVEAGVLRRNLGAADSHYGLGFATGTWRRGLNTTTTGEVRLEASRSRQVGGVAAVHAFGADWLARAGALIARDQTLGAGHRWLLGAERPGYAASFAVTLEGSSRNYRSIGEELTSVSLQYQLAAQASIYSDWGRFGAALAIQQPYDLERVATVSLNYNKTIRRDWQFSAYATHAFARSGGSTVGMALTVPIDRQTSSTSSVQVHGGKLDAYSSVQHTPLGSTGLAWRALAGYQSEEPRAEGGLYYLGEHGQWNGDVSVTGRQANLRLGTSGGLLWTGGRGYATPRFDASAALVEVPGYAGVGVGLGAEISTHTDDKGYALVRNLGAYRSNQIRLDPNGLPMSAEVDSIEAEAVPAWRSVARVQFPVRGGRGALIKIEFDDGEPAPAGATVRLPGEDREFYVARRGEAYVTGLQASNQLELRWGDRSCRLAVDLPPGDADNIARVGPVRCTGVKR